MAHAEAIRDAYHAVRSDYPTFVVSLVGSGLKNASFDPALTETLLDNAVYVHETVRDTYDPSDPHDFLTGIDLVNEEDKSRSLEEFAPMLLNIRKEHPDLHILLHAGESLYADSDNVIDAYLIGAERIGHGLNTYRYPDLLEDMIKDQVCLEVCPISNQTLRYVEDLRTHPATEYLKRGLPIALCSDDPAYQEHTTLADDFFAAIVCWDLGIPEIKQLCRNSIQYSSVDEALKKEMLFNWEKDWETFISQVSSF